MDTQSGYSMVRLRVETHAPGGITKWRRDHLAQLLRRNSRDFLPTLESQAGGIRALTDEICDCHVTLLVNDASVYGVLAVTVDEAEANVHLLVVDREVRKQGWGAAMHHALASALGEKVAAWSTSTWSTNAAYLSLAQQMGFIVESREPGAHGPGVDALYLRSKSVAQIIKSV